MPLRDMATEYEESGWEEACDHGKFDDEECPECDAYYAAHPEEVEDDDESDEDEDGGELVGV